MFTAAVSQVRLVLSDTVSLVHYWKQTLNSDQLLRKLVTWQEIHVWKNVRNTVSKQLVALRSSANDNLRDGHEPCDVKYEKLRPCLHEAELFFIWRHRAKPVTEENRRFFEGSKANVPGKSRFSGVFLYLNGWQKFAPIWPNESRFHPIFSG